MQRPQHGSLLMVALKPILSHSSHHTHIYVGSLVTSFALKHTHCFSRIFKQTKKTLETKTVVIKQI